MKSILSLLVFAVVMLTAALGNPVLAAVTLGVGGVLVAAPSAAFNGTLVHPLEILNDVASAFIADCPVIQTLGGEWKNEGLIPGKEYVAHISSAVAVQDLTTTLIPSPASVLDNLSDLKITASYKKGAPLSFNALSAVATDKNTAAYAKVTREAGRSLANQFMADLWTFARSEYFTNGITYGTADFDLDAANEAQGIMNVNGAGPSRTMIVSASYANTFGQVAGVASRDYLGQPNGASVNRSWRNVAGFELIQEWAGMTPNNGTALTGVAATASTDLFTKAAHGLLTGSRVKVGSGWSASIGITANTYAYVILVSSSTFKLASTLALAYAGTAIDVALDATGGTITPEENINAFATDLSGLQFIAGPLDFSKTDEMAEMLGIQQIINHDVIQHESGLNFGVVKYQDSNGNLLWMPHIVYGFRAGRGLNTNAPGAQTDKGGVLIRTA